MKHISIAFSHPDDARSAENILVQFGDATQIKPDNANQLSADVPDALEAKVRTAVDAINGQTDDGRAFAVFTDGPAGRR